MFEAMYTKKYTGVTTSSKDKLRKLHQIIQKSEIRWTTETQVPKGYRFDESARLITNAQVYAVAEKYDASSVKDYACETSVFNGNCTVFGFMLAIELVWTTTPSSDRGLRQSYLRQLKGVKSILDDMSQRRREVEKRMWSNALEGCIRSCPDFAIDYLLKLGQKGWGIED